MIIWHNTEKSNWKNGWKGKTKRGQYNIDIVRYTGDVKVEMKDGTLVPLGLPKDQVTFRDIETGEQVTKTDKDFLEYVDAKIVTHFNRIFIETGIDLRFNLNKKVINNDELPVPYSSGRRGHNTWSIYNLLPSNARKLENGVFRNNPHRACGLAAWDANGIELRIAYRSLVDCLFSMRLYIA